MNPETVAELLAWHQFNFQLIALALLTAGIIFALMMVILSSLHGEASVTKKRLEARDADADNLRATVEAQRHRIDALENAPRWEER